MFRNINDLIESCIILDASNKIKISKHLIIQLEHCYFVNLQHVKNVFDEILYSCSDPFIATNLLRFCDTNLYERKSCSLRLALSTKFKDRDNIFQNHRRV